MNRTERGDLNKLIEILDVASVSDLFRDVQGGRKLRSGEIP